MNHSSPAARPALVDLSEDARTLIVAFRVLAAGREACPSSRRQFTDACGPAGDELWEVLGVFVGLLATRGRRRLSIGRPGWSGLEHDEQLLLAVFDAAQRSDATRMHAQLSWLFGSNPGAPATAAVLTLAAAFAERDLSSAMPEPLSDAVWAPSARQARARA